MHYLPSIMEPCSVAILESLALGIPVIASRSGGSVDLIKNGLNGFHFNESDSNDLADLLSKISERQKAPKMTTEEIRQSIRFCSNQEVLKSYLKIYHKTISFNLMRRGVG